MRRVATRAARRVVLSAALLAAYAASAADVAAAADAAAQGAGAEAQDGGAAVDPEAPTVAARVDRAEAHVGDPVHVSLVAISPVQVSVNLPGTLDLGALSLLDRKESEQNLGDGRIRREFTLTVAAYETGEISVPAIDVTYLGQRGDMRSVRTAPIPLRIVSLIANEPEPALKEGAVPVSVLEPRLWPAYLAGGVAAAALGGLITALVVRRMRARRGARPGPPPRPAHEIALERLDRLGAYGFLENADNRPFYFAVSEVIRDYLGGRYGFDSLEMTTDELVDKLRKKSGRELVVGEIEGWLSACDLVKFAKISPTAAESRGALESAIRIVTATRPVPEPLAPAAATPGEARHA